MKHIKFILLVILTIMLSTITTGCSLSDDILNDNDISDYIYAAETIPVPVLPVGLRHINNIVFFDETVFFTARYDNYDINRIQSNKIFSMDMDGANLTELKGYALNIPSDATISNVSINNLITDNAGNLWVVEILFTDSDKRVIYIRKLDKTGAELLSFDISGFINEYDAYIRSFNVDDADNIYIGLNDNIKVFNSTGRLLFTLNMRNGIQLIRLPDGTVAHNTANGTLRIIDTENQAWGKTVDLPFGVYNIFTGNNKHQILFFSGNTLNGLNIETSEITQILDFIDSDLMFDTLSNAKMLADGRIIIVTYTSPGIFQHPVSELFILSKTSSQERNNRELITLAGININGIIRSAVVRFNVTNPTHRIQITDYAIYNLSTDDISGLTKLTTEIISGKIPDILVLSELPVRQYITKGLLADLNPFFERDPESYREDLFDSIIQASQTDGALYRIFPAFNISTVIGNPEIVGNTPGWTMNEFKEFLDMNPEADIPMGVHMTKETFLQIMIEHNIEQFVDWNSGTVNFNGSDFTELLETANKFPKEYDPDIWGFGEWIGWVASGRQIMLGMNFGEIINYRMDRSMFGGDIVFKGYPGKSGLGSMFHPIGDISITALSEYRQEAWEFIRLLMSEEFGRDNLNMGFPVNKILFKERLADALTEGEIRMDLETGFRVMVPAISVKEAELITELIDSTTSIFLHEKYLFNIISESASDYFNGRNTAHETARIIQNRASNYMAEQN